MTLTTAMWIGIGVLLTASVLLAFYEERARSLRIPILRALHERGNMDLTGIIRCLREMELYPPPIPKFLVEHACKIAIRGGLLTHGGHAFIARFTVSSKGLEFLDQYYWRKGKKKFPAQ